MDIRLKRKIDNYLDNIYLIDIIIVLLCTITLMSIFIDYAQVNKIQKVQAMKTMVRNREQLIIVGLLDIIYIIKIINVIRKNPRYPKIKSKMLNNIVFVLKNGFKYKETRMTLVLFITLALIVLITYLYFLATGGYQNNIFVRFFQTYPFKSSVLLILLLFIIIIYETKKTLDISLVNQALKGFSKGNLEEDLKLEGSAAIRELEDNINLIKSRYKQILDEGVKNEKLKTELISNVSHDLKTPLTSIISYVNILKSTQITEEERLKYIDILEHKSLKLKTLIEDLFEMSKINSGKLELEKQCIDIVSLIYQGVGEYSSLYDDKNISFKVKSESDSIYLNLDGKMMSRALENIIINSLKYSLNNTRVYIDIYTEKKYVIIAMKNVANYEMNFNEDDMFERFVRGDKSRNSKIEGSGLGLAITKSIVELHGGKVTIEKDGDMFKIYLKLPLE